MSAVLALAPRLARAGGRNQRTTTALAVLAFAVTSALGLSVLGGLLGFLGRAADPTSDLMVEIAPTYVPLAWTAVVLLLVPLLALGGAAARLGVSRRDARLATLRLLGVTPREVVLLTVVETAWQGLLGAVLGVVGYAALLPVWTSIPFQGVEFGAAELWVGWWALLGTVTTVPVVAAVSGAVSLRRVVVSPLGVARRETPPRLRVVRVVAVVVTLVGFALVALGGSALGAFAVVVLIGALAAVLGALNLLGPWTIGVLGRILARRARTPAQLLAARHLLDDPRGAWRVVGGLGLASFVAGVLSMLPVLTAGDTAGDAAGTVLMRDLGTGTLLTLAITFAVAAASAGIMAAASVLDRRREYAVQRLAGVPVELFDSVRRREVLAPLVFVAGTSTLAAWLVLLPLFGAAAVTAPQGLLQLVGCLVGGGLLVLGATELSRPLLRSVLAETVLRSD